MHPQGRSPNPLRFLGTDPERGKGATRLAHYAYAPLAGTQVGKGAMHNGLRQRIQVRSRILYDCLCKHV